MGSSIGPSFFEMAILYQRSVSWLQKAKCHIKYVHRSSSQLCRAEVRKFPGILTEVMLTADINPLWIWFGSGCRLGLIVDLLFNKTLQLAVFLCPVIQLQYTRKPFYGVDKLRLTLYISLKFMQCGMLD